MKKFSDVLVQDRKFEVGGETFTWRYPYWQETASIFDADVAASQNGDIDLTAKRSIEDYIERIAVFLDPEDESPIRWKKLAKRKNSPIAYFQFHQVYRWLLEVTSGRPTPPPSDSDPGGGSSEASSAEESR